MAAIASDIKPLAVKLELDIRDRLKTLASSRQRSTHWMMREAIAQYIEREEKQESYRQEGLRGQMSIPSLCNLDLTGQLVRRSRTLKNG